MSRTFKHQTEWPKDGKPKKVKRLKRKLENKKLEKFLEDEE